VDEIISSGLHEYLDGLQTNLNQLGAGIHETFFAIKTPQSPKKPVRQQVQ